MTDLLQKSRATILVVFITTITSCELDLYHYMKVVYVVDGSAANVFIVYRDKGGEIVEVSPSIPWMHEIRAMGAFRAYLLVHNETATGDIHASVQEDGKVAAEEQSSDPFAVITINLSL